MPIVATLLVAGGLWTAAQWQHGLAWSPDSMTYHAVAQALLEGDGLHTGRHWRGLWEPYPALTYWPPGYPLLLAVVGAVVGDLTTAASWVALGGFVLSVLLGTELVVRLSGRPAARWLGPWLALFGPLLFVSTRAWSEPLFVVLWTAQTLVLIHALRGADREGSGRRWAVVGALAGSLLWVRHAAAPLLVVLPMGVAVGCWVLLPAASRARGTARAVTSVAVCEAVVAGPWVLGSWLVRGHFGYRYPPSLSTEDLGANLWAASKTSFVEGVLPGHASAWSWMPVVLGAALLGLGALALARRAQALDSAPRTRVTVVVAALLGVQGLISAATYVAARAQYHLDEPDMRMLLPATLPLVWVGLAAVGRRLSPRALAVFGACGIAWSCVVGAAHVRVPTYKPFGFYEHPRHQETIAWVNDHAAPDDLVLALMDSLVHHRTGRPTLGPLGPPWALHLTVDDVAQWATLWPEEVGGRVLLVLPRSDSNGGTSLLSQLRAGLPPQAGPVRFELLAQTEGIRVYWAHLR